MSPSDARLPVLLCVRPACPKLDNRGRDGVQDPLGDLLAAVMPLLDRHGAVCLSADRQRILANFAGAAEAFACSRDIHRLVTSEPANALPGVRIGCFSLQPDAGLVDLQTHAIECVERLTGHAALGQTVACGEFAVADPALAAQLRRLEADDWACDQSGVAAPVFQVPWQDEAPTRMVAFAPRELSLSLSHRLHLRWRGQHRVLDHDTPPLTLGRGAQADIEIESEFASRIHARVSHLGRAFMLTDTSRNGTYVRTDNAAEIYLHHDQLILRSEGSISLGRRAATAPNRVLYFKLEGGADPDLEDPG